MRARILILYFIIAVGFSCLIVIRIESFPVILICCLYAWARILLIKFILIILSSCICGVLSVIGGWTLVFTGHCILAAKAFLALHSLPAILTDLCLHDFLMQQLFLQGFEVSLRIQYIFWSVVVDCHFKFLMIWLSWLHSLYLLIPLFLIVIDHPKTPAPWSLWLVGHHVQVIRVLLLLVIVGILGIIHIWFHRVLTNNWLRWICLTRR